MGLLEMLYGKVSAPEPAPQRPDALHVKARRGCVHAATEGRLVAMADLPDPVFAAGAMGPCVGIKPQRGVVYAPVNGVVSFTTNTLHALGITSDDGMEVLIHVGVDTVNMRGDGFHGYVAKGQRVRVGEPLMVMDLGMIAAAGYSDVVITVVTNFADYPAPSILQSDMVKAGDVVMRFDGPVAGAAETGA